MKRNLKFWLGSATAFALCSSASAAIVVNEFAFDDPSTDNEEFIELYNSGASAVDISDYSLELVNGNGGAVYSTVDFPVGASIAAGGFYLIQVESSDTVGFPLAALPAGVTADHLHSGANSPLQNGSPDGMRLKDNLGAIIDAVGYETHATGLPADSVEGDGILGDSGGTLGYQRTASTFDNAFGRTRDGLDTNDNTRDFCRQAASPRASNNAPQFATTLPYSNDGAGTAGTTTYGEFWGSFTDWDCKDPAVGHGGEVPGVSPGGGNAIFPADGTGGGDAQVFNSGAFQDWTIECYAHLSSAALTGADVVAWEFGIGNTDVSLSLTPTSSGSRGLFWRYDNSSAGASLKLRERYGSFTRDIATVNITSGSNDGWQRLYLNRTGTNVTARVGGTLGNLSDGTLFTVNDASTAGGSLYTGFRELMATNNLWMWLDNFSASASNPSNVADWSIY